MMGHMLAEQKKRLCRMEKKKKTTLSQRDTEYNIISGSAEHTALEMLLELVCLTNNS